MASPTSSKQTSRTTRTSGTKTTQDKPVTQEPTTQDNSTIPTTEVSPMTEQTTSTTITMDDIANADVSTGASARKYADPTKLSDEQLGVEWDRVRALRAGLEVQQARAGATRFLKAAKAEAIRRRAAQQS